MAFTTFLPFTCVDVIARIFVRANSASGVAPSLVEGTILSEHVSLKYSKIKWTYTQQNIAGGVRGSTTGGWDLAANKVAA